MTPTRLATITAIIVAALTTATGCAASMPEDTEARCNFIYDKGVDEVKKSGGAMLLSALQQKREENCDPENYDTEAEFKQKVDELQEEFANTLDIEF